ncbi:MAG: hypothetical protein HY906_15620 [Deltaproteobacteria bacterium]|nr:hypothetical protein [Deltaproteobacteria bacterium]
MRALARCWVPLRFPLLPALVLATAASLALGCGAGGVNPGNIPDGGLHGDGAGGGDGPVGQQDGPTYGDAHSPFDPDAFWAQDPPPEWCGPDGGATPPQPPGGTPDCPDDKNRQGCPCSPQGTQAPCWPGLRANRNLGNCKDGTTTCISNDEFGLVWGPCAGYVLPDPTATKGKAACKCFSGGQWKIDNLSPCFVSWDSYATYYAVSTYIDGAGKAQCPSNIPSAPPLTPQPGKTWSTDTIQVDCAGHFKLCYALKAGTAATPQATDCELVKVCTETDYPTANQVQAIPDLPAWASSNTTCATQFAKTGGYGEMSVVGMSVLCDAVDDGNGQPYVFNRVQYCPLSCNTNPSAPECQNCNQGGSGNF